MSELNKRVVRRLIEQVWNQGQLAAIDELCARDWVGHATHNELDSPAAFKAYVAAQRLAFPDLAVVVEDQIAEDDKVATRWTGSGTQQSGKTALWTGITLARLANGKVIEGWTSARFAGWLEQIDAVTVGEHADGLQGKGR
jgi:predicted ester cyclase